MHNHPDSPLTLTSTTGDGTEFFLPSSPHANLSCRFQRPARKQTTHQGLSTNLAILCDSLQTILRIERRDGIFGIQHTAHPTVHIHSRLKRVQTRVFVSKRVASIVFAIPLSERAHIFSATIREVSARTCIFELWTETRVRSSLKRDLNCRLPRRNQEVIIERKPTEGELGLELFALLTVSRLSFLSYHSSTAGASGIHPTPLFGASSACHDNFFIY